MRLPVIFVVIQFIISVFVVIIGYYTINNITSQVIKRLSDDLLNQSSKVAQQIFDERSTRAYHSLQTLLSTAQFSDAIESEDKNNLEEALLNVYNFSSVNMPYDLLFVHQKDTGYLVDASYLTLDEGLLQLLRETPASQVSAMRNVLHFVKYKDLNLLVMKIAIPRTKKYLYGAIQIASNVPLLQNIKQQTNSQCMQVYYKNELITSLGEKGSCSRYLNTSLQKEYIFRFVKEGNGIIKQSMSNQETLANFDIAMVIPVDSILAFQKNLQQSLFIVMIVVLCIVLLIQYLFSKFIGRVLSNLIAFSNNKQNAILQVPNTGIKEFDTIAAANHKAMVSLQEEIQARQITENKLHQSNKELIVRTKQANIANEEKSRFLANMSHEIRTPMNAVINLARFTLQTELTHRQRHYIDTIYHSGRTLLRLVNDVLDLSKIEAKQLEIERNSFNLEKVIIDVRDTVSTKIINKPVQFKLDIDWSLNPMLIGDSLRLFQILINLCDNAVKFTEQGTVTLAIKQAEQHDDEVILEFTVIDTGIGIDAKQKEKIFANFSQADSSIARKYGGTGLGLSIVTKLVELMGGQIQLESEENKGSRFYFFLKFKQEKTLPFNENSQTTIQAKNIYLYISHKQNKAIERLFEARGLVIKWCLPTQNVPSILSQDTTIGGLFFDWKNESQRFDIEDISQYCQRYNFNIKKAVWVRDIGLEKTHESPASDKFHILINPPTLSELNDVLHVIKNSTAKNSAMSDISEYAKQKRPNLANKRILVAEDNAVNQEIISIFLSDVESDFDLVESGLDAIERISKQHYDVILMDVQMPKMDGIEATIEIRKLYTKIQLPIIGLSAYTMSSDIERCIHAGMNAHLGKPIEPEDLYDTLEKVISNNDNNNYTSDTVINVTTKPQITNNTSQNRYPGIDVKQGLARVANNQDIYHRLLHSFTNTHYNDASLIEQAIMQAQYDTAASLLHAIKGAAATISANDLYACIVKFEQSCKQQNIKLINQQVQEFNQLLEIALSSIKQIVSAQ